MSIDLVSALDGGVRSQAGASSKGGPGEFPSVLRSTLDEGAASLGSSSSEAQSPNRPGEGSKGSKTQADGTSSRARAGADSESSSKSDGSKPAGDDEDATATAEAAVVGASTGAAQGRNGGSIEAATASDGRLSDLDSEEASRGLAQRGRLLASGEAGARPVGAEQTGEAVAAQESKLAGTGGSVAGAQTLDPRAELAAGVAPNRGGLAESGQEVATRAGREVGAEETSILDSAESRNENQADSDARPGDGKDGRANEQAYPDRAADGIPSGVTDPQLQQAIENAAASQRAPDSIAVEGAGTLTNPIAGAVTETTPTTTPGAPTPPAASDAIAVQTEWLASRGGGTARLLLSPPLLGEIAIRVSLQGGVVNVVMVAHEAAARSIAEEQSDRLAQAFSSRDLRMESFEVRRGEPQALADGDLGQFTESGTHQEGRTEDDQSAGTESSRASLGRTLDHDDAERAVQPEILSVGPEMGVDLRI